MTSVSDKIKSIVEFLTSPFETEKENGFFGDLQEEFETGYETDRNAALEPAFKQTSPIRNERKVISMPQRGYEHQKGYEVVVFEPRAYNESIQIAQALKERKTVILNLQLLDREESQRIVDFLCGCTHALDGNQRKIGDFVFIFTPNNINLTQEMVSSKLTRDALWNAPAPQAN